MNTLNKFSKVCKASRKFLKEGDQKIIVVAENEAHTFNAKDSARIIELIRELDAEAYRNRQEFIKVD